MKSPQERTLDFLNEIYSLCSKDYTYINMSNIRSKYRLTSSTNSALISKQIIIKRKIYGRGNASEYIWNSRIPDELMAKDICSLTYKKAKASVDKSRENINKTKKIKIAESNISNFEEKIVNDMFTVINEIIDSAPLELRINKEVTFIFIPMYLFLLSRISTHKGYHVSVSPYSNKIILSNLQNYCLIEKTF